MKKILKRTQMVKMVVMKIILKTERMTGMDDYYNGDLNGKDDGMTLITERMVEMDQLVTIMKQTIVSLKDSALVTILEANAFPHSL